MTTTIEKLGPVEEKWPTTPPNNILTYPDSTTLIAAAWHFLLIVFGLALLIIAVFFLRFVYRSVRFGLWDTPKTRKRIYRLVQVVKAGSGVYMATIIFWDLEPSSRSLTLLPMITELCCSGWWWGIVGTSLFVALNLESALLGGPIISSYDEKVSNCIVQGLTRAKDQIKLTRRPRELESAWDNLLQAAAEEVAQKLNCKRSKIFKANLILARPGTTDDPQNKMVVVSRSEYYSDVPKHYAVDDSIVAYQAMKNNATMSSANVENKRYKAVVATPICLGQTAYGAITVDSTEIAFFNGRETHVDVVLRKYAAIILLTLHESDPSYPCELRE